MFTKGNFQNIINQAKSVQEKLESTQAELEKLEVKGQAGGGMVVAKVNGKSELLSLNIDPEILNDDVEMVEDLIVAAVNQALRKSSEESQKRMSGISGSMLGALGELKIPGS
ncbi:MAG TPA: YbaB/EbfC family nucleoid-associated protein [Candidatus Marinimicrobia bacterium]|jgi:DNA-binding YbaB/EbfC family protein|nr:YbaB/EbfC family nucleoid-associated protein [Candidatus Neomarinimicrobiota bacterium]HHZ97989.1 YbaB/EbfC family nucleoid-associated protein [Candidatus Neomarinimicrobiota bacterium]HIB71666.1 YbaB/EbfC family nucleoid-associated protein [Candidatus Neomarinimicrobiota bacterium]HIB95025.1 YbaB/EbfC family nucleoid-associated protein [Candidatus Neomarinimicrobiota bacterium]HIN61499.1 YbaB/EbfC family nucleoid-associated protein [Candidatus Neomarinimicrobiota bacterium]